MRQFSGAVSADFGFLGRIGQQLLIGGQFLDRLLAGLPLAFDVGDARLGVILAQPPRVQFQPGLAKGFAR